MSALTREQVEKWAKLAEQATPGPWRWDQSYGIAYEHGIEKHWCLENPESASEGKTISAALVLLNNTPDWFGTPLRDLPDVAFIAAARTAVPALAADWIAQQEEIDGANETWNKLSTLRADLAEAEQKRDGAIELVVELESVARPVLAPRYQREIKLRLAALKAKRG